MPPFKVKINSSTKSFTGRKAPFKVTLFLNPTDYVAYHHGPRNMAREAYLPVWHCSPPPFSCLLQIFILFRSSSGLQVPVTEYDERSEVDKRKGFLTMLATRGE